eukprot:166667_1
MIDRPGEEQTRPVTELAIPEGKWQWWDDSGPQWKDYLPGANAEIEKQFWAGNTNFVLGDTSDGRLNPPIELDISFDKLTQKGRSDYPIERAIRRVNDVCGLHKLRPYFKFDHDWTTAKPWKFVRPPLGKSFGPNTAASCVDGIWMVGRFGEEQTRRVSDLIIPKVKWQWWNDYSQWDDY